ncbi:G/U mismatch-specific uracil-DNA glycosylase [Hydrogenispora ethanolica]|uniref:G/U mismatch-specific uracil-DNA glycosylase n=1 Tax=Hydrogenispora ethanolica TaxID=1082276 RepID=A0A4R1RS88_HYDET|nr:mismatch-specific DNA-glycosylase [Hydrogenispora ethanolica]TCL69335.1 G/U mismatch-specific uracil-DNA glycosylase [Hydrogenispora ethanolica]
MGSTELILPNLLREDLTILFVGINPGLRSAAVRHHFAGHSNRFWRFLYESGLTPAKMRAEEDALLLKLGFGITNIVPRPTAAASELRPEELRAGAADLLELLRHYRPLIAAYLGKDIYKYLSGRRECNWGIQEPGVVEGVTDFLLPNPSGLNRMVPAEQLKYYQDLKALSESHR